MILSEKLWILVSTRDRAKELYNSSFKADELARKAAQSQLTGVLHTVEYFQSDDLCLRITNEANKHWQSTRGTREAKRLLGDHC